MRIGARPIYRGGREGGREGGRSGCGESMTTVLWIAIKEEREGRDEGGREGGREGRHLPPWSVARRWIRRRSYRGARARGEWPGGGREGGKCCSRNYNTRKRSSYPIPPSLPPSLPLARGPFHFQKQPPRPRFSYPPVQSQGAPAEQAPCPPSRPPPLPWCRCFP